MPRLGFSLGAFAVAALALLTSRVAHAHDQWLEAEPFASSTPGREKIYLYSGDRFASPQPVSVKSRAYFSHFFVQSTLGRRDILGDMREDTQPIALLTSGKVTGSFIIALEAAPRTLELDAEKFGAYLLEERLLDVLEQRMQSGTEDDPGRERFTRCLKAIVQIGPTLDHVAMVPVGQELEIVPDQHPYGVMPGGQLGVRVLFHGEPLAGRAITAANRYRGELTKKTVRLDAKGHATFTLPRAGDWMIRLVHMVPSPQRDVEWRSFWSNLTFSLPEPGAASTEPPAARH